MIRDLGIELDVPTMLVLEAVDSHDPAAGEVTVGSLAEHLGVDQSRASRMVQGAVHAGYVTRVACQADGRSSRIELTEDARDLAKRAREVRLKYLARILADWPNGECRELARLLTAFTARLSSSVAKGEAAAPLEQRPISRGASK